MKSRSAAVPKLDPFLLVLLAVVGLASILPARGEAAEIASRLSDVAISSLFFLYGAKLSRQAIVAGMRAWPVHIVVILATFVMFPLLGIAAKALADLWLNPAIGAGILLLCLMPSTVQSSIAFTAQAGGNVPAAVCSASASSILGVVVTPALAALLLASGGNRVPLGPAWRSWPGNTLGVTPDQLHLYRLVGSSFLVASDPARGPYLKHSTSSSVRALTLGGQR